MSAHPHPLLHSQCRTFSMHSHSILNFFFLWHYICPKVETRSNTEQKKHVLWKISQNMFHVHHKLTIRLGNINMFLNDNNLINHSLLACDDVTITCWHSMNGCEMYRNFGNDVTLVHILTLWPQWAFSRFWHIFLNLSSPLLIRCLEAFRRFTTQTVTLSLWRWPIDRLFTAGW